MPDGKPTNRKKRLLLEENYDDTSLAHDTFADKAIGPHARFGGGHDPPQIASLW